MLEHSIATEVGSILQSVVRVGTGTRAQVANLVIAGKTGTTENYGDAWFVGWTKKYTVAVWVGYPDEFKSMETEFSGQPVAGGTYPAAICRTFIEGDLRNNPPKPEETPTPTAPAPTGTTAPAPTATAAPTTAPPAPTPAPTHGAAGPDTRAHHAAVTGRRHRPGRRRPVAAGFRGPRARMAAYRGCRAPPARSAQWQSHGPIKWAVSLRRGTRPGGCVGRGIQQPSRAARAATRCARPPRRSATAAPAPW